MNKLKRTIFSITFNLILLMVSFAQDTHYWTQQYGSRSSLLGGAVIGGVRDNSAVYYNPGALVMSDSTAISVSANAYQFDQLKINNGAGTNINLKSGQTQIIPLIISGIYKFKKHPQHAFGYAILTKHQTGIKMSARNDTRMNVINDSNNAGDEEFLGQYNIKSSLNEQWFGGTYSYKVGKHLALGITAFGAYRTQSLERSYVARVTPDVTSFYSQYVAQLGSYSEIKSLEYSHVRAFSKLGLALDYSKFKFGLTITTPGIHLVGTGTYSRDEQINNLNYTNANLTTYTAGATTYNQLIVKVDSFKTELDSYSINDRQTTDGDKMKVNYKSPLSIGLGFEYGFKHSKLCFSAEWFAPILDYDIIAPVEREVIRPKNAKYNYTSIDFLTIREGARGVVNFALAYEQSITKKIDLLGSFRTNFSSSPFSLPEYGDAISQTYWNITHYTLGVNYKKTKSDISIGFSFANGRGYDIQAVNMTEPTERGYLEGDWQDVDVNFTSFSLLLGYTYYFR